MSEEEKIRKLKDKADLESLQEGDLVDSTLGLLAFEGMSYSQRYKFVSHHKSLVRASETSFSVKDGAIWFDDTIPLHLGRYNPRIKELCSRPLLMANKSDNNRIYQRRVKLYEKTRGVN